MPTNDLVFIDWDYKIVGWLVGMSEEEIAEYRKKYKVWSYGHHEKFWNEPPKDVNTNASISLSCHQS